MPAKTMKEKCKARESLLDKHAPKQFGLDENKMKYSIWLNSNVSRNILLLQNSLKCSWLAFG